MPTNINADNGVVSGIAGLKTSADNSGVLALQTNGTTALTVSTTLALGVGSTPSYGTAGQVLTSAGSGAPPTWSSAGGGSQWTTTGSNIYYNTGTVGVGTTAPSSWSAIAAIDVGTGKGASYAGNDGGAYVTQNAYFNGSNFIYKSTGKAGYSGIVDGGYVWYTAASGTGGNTISFTKSLELGKGTTLALEGASTGTGTGITFPATQSASSNANTLDDYEEGTWTPTAGGSLTVVGTFSSSGKYTKIGRVVHVIGTISATSLTLTANQQVIFGLPFNNTSSSAGGTITSGTNTAILFNLTGANTELYASASSGPSSEFYFSVTYLAST